MNAALSSMITTGRGLVRWRALLTLVVTAAVAVAALTGTASLAYSLGIGLVYAVAIVGNNWVTATLGEINLGAGAWLAVGAYLMAFLVQAGLPLVPAALCAIAGTAVVGTIVAVPVVRLTGIFTALVTFAVAFAVPTLIVELQPFTGGAAGVALPVDPTVLGVTLGGSTTGMLVLSSLVYVLVAVGSALALRGSWGRAALVVGEAAPAAAVFGYRVRRVQILSWGVSAAVCGLAGVLFALTVGYLGPTQFDPFLSITLLVAGLVGGVRSPYGALLGGLLVGTLPPQLQSVVPASATGIVFGLVLLVALAAGGKGLSDAVERCWPALSRSRRGARP
ncbi:branched-chain amino acid ABC transporter permease [Pseudonocardia sp. RS010]|uniref:branched-chain amino acid ABC transporter permease n=1 Tax=Pseudonocardia sp. RS010 TaxID=3385979 RepID=UPI0039A02891